MHNLKSVGIFRSLLVRFVSVECHVKIKRHCESVVEEKSEREETREER